MPKFNYVLPKKWDVNLDLNLRRVLNAVLCLLGNSGVWAFSADVSELIGSSIFIGVSVQVIPRIGVEGDKYGKCLAQS